MTPAGSPQQSACLPTSLYPFAGLIQGMDKQFLTALRDLAASVTMGRIFQVTPPGPHTPRVF